MGTDVSPYDDVIDVRDVIERFEELEREAIDAYESEAGTDGEDLPTDFDALAYLDEAEADEFARLRELLDDLKGNGGDHQWQGDWYPVTLIRDSYFEDYAHDLAEELGMISEADRWPATCIDWGQAARELQMDYTSVEFDGVTFWTR